MPRSRSRAEAPSWLQRERSLRQFFVSWPAARMVDVDAIETERLVLRAYTGADAPRVLAIHSRLDVIQWLGNPPYTPMATLDEAHDWISAKHRKAEVDQFQRTYAIEVRDTGVVAGSAQIGRVSLLGQEWDGEYEVGWHLHPDTAGHGYATEAAAAVPDDAFV